MNLTDPDLQQSKQAADYLQRRIKEFQLEQQRWDSQRTTEQQLLEQKARQLTEAWLRLESEQRALLQSRGANSAFDLRHEPNHQADDGLFKADPIPLEVDVCQPIDQPAAELNQQESAEMALSSVQADLPIESKRVRQPRGVVPRDVAVRQFEKLKHEIQSSRRPR